MNANQSVTNVADAVIDEGTFKYVLLEVTDEAGGHKTIVRGFTWAGYHDDIFQHVRRQLGALGLAVDISGGGRIYHFPQRKLIKVYGYSVDYGPADHAKTVEILKQKFPEYADITFSNDGY